MILSVLNIRSTMGWAARAYEKGLKVSSAPSFFGVEKHVVKDGRGGGVALSQSTEIGRELDTDGFNEAQLAIVRTLRDCGLIAEHPDLGASPASPSNPNDAPALPSDQYQIASFFLNGWTRLLCKKVPGRLQITEERIEHRARVGSARIAKHLRAHRELVVASGVIGMSIWIEDDISSSRHVVCQHAGRQPFTYATFNYHHLYTDNAGTLKDAEVLARSLGALEPITRKQRSLQP